MSRLVTEQGDSEPGLIPLVQKAKIQVQAVQHRWPHSPDVALESKLRYIIKKATNIEVHKGYGALH